MARLTINIRSLFAAIFTGLHFLVAVHRGLTASRWTSVVLLGYFGQNRSDYRRITFNLFAFPVPRKGRQGRGSTTTAMGLPRIHLSGRFFSPGLVRGRSILGGQSAGTDELEGHEPVQTDLSRFENHAHATRAISLSSS